MDIIREREARVHVMVIDSLTYGYFEVRLTFGRNRKLKIDQL